jgi:acetolactate synthase-1/2/3 large subunit
VVTSHHLEKSDRIPPYPFFEAFTRALPESATVVAGNGSACVCLFQAGIVKEGQRIFWNSGCASMGFDLPAAIGAASGGAGTVWCIAGDGSFQMNLQELATVAHNRLPIKIVYLDNGGYASIRQTQSNFFQSQYGCGNASGLGFPDIGTLAKAYGIRHVLSTRLDQIPSHQAETARSNDPVVWEVRLTLDYSFEPKLSSEKLPDGRIVSKPLEDMFPFLPREQFASNMVPENRP